MKTKLTLNLNKAVIEKGRSIAKNKHKSLSVFVEELLSKEIDKDTKEKQKLIRELHGIAGSVPAETIWKDVIRKSAVEKHDK